MKNVFIRWSIKFYRQRRSEIMLKNHNGRIDSEDNSHDDSDRFEQKVDRLARSLLLLSHWITFDRIFEGLFVNVWPDIVYYLVVCTLFAFSNFSPSLWLTSTCAYECESGCILPRRSISHCQSEPKFRRFILKVKFSRLS